MSKTKKNPLKAPTQVVISLDVQTQLGQFADKELFGKPVIEHLLTQLLKNTPFRDLIIVLDQHATQLRQQIRALALHLPIKIRILSQTQTSTLANDLLLAAPYLQEEFFFTTIDNEAANFQLRQLSNYQADGVFAVDQNQNLLDSYLFKKKFLDFLSNQTPDKPWPAILSAFSVDFLVKNVQFDSLNITETPAKNLEEFWLTKIQNWWPEILPQSKISPQAQIAPTARLKGKVVIESGARINEYSVIEGPAYIGKNSKIGCFCHLQQVVVEKENLVDDYTKIEKKYLGPPKTSLTNGRQKR